MLSRLSISNFALIEHLEVDWPSGFSTITGETGAGKSIMLGALQLLLGARADLKSLRNPDQKCIIEGEFHLNGKNLKPLFDQADLDFDLETIIRREISPSGKSRAFVNDSPVALSDLKPIGEALVDIHSQHQNLGLTNADFQLELLDVFCDHPTVIQHYREAYAQWKEGLNKAKDLEEAWATWQRESDYTSFLFNELEEASISDPEELESLESEVQQLEHADGILSDLQALHQLANAEPHGFLSLIREGSKHLDQASNHWAALKLYAERMEAARLELEDIVSDLENKAEDVEANPTLLEEKKTRLNLLNNLLVKHQAEDIQALMEIHESLAGQVGRASTLEAELENARAEVDLRYTTLIEKGGRLTESRQARKGELEETLIKLLQNLGMPQAQIEIEIKASEPSSKGMNEVNILFTANKGMPPGGLKDKASGGELSRIMLAFKSILAKSRAMPTIIFDEIDTGVSGEVALQMAELMRELGNSTQVISITHLPNIAARGGHQFKVLKTHEGEQTATQIKALSFDERILELAEMLEGKKPGQHALDSAKALMGNLN